jgi:hypothetical protein
VGGRCDAELGSDNSMHYCGKCGGRLPTSRVASDEPSMASSLSYWVGRAISGCDVMWASGTAVRCNNCHHPFRHCPTAVRSMLHASTPGDRPPRRRAAQRRRESDRPSVSGMNTFTARRIGMPGRYGLRRSFLPQLPWRVYPGGFSPAPRTERPLSIVRTAWPFCTPGSGGRATPRWVTIGG